MQARVLFVYLSVCLSAIDTSGAVHYFCSQPNEVFLECGCHRNCRNPARNCGGDCQRGCFCKGDELRGDDGDCVDPKYCPEIQFNAFFTLEPYVKGVSLRESNKSEPRSEENISNTSEPQEEEEIEPYTRKIYALEPFGKFGPVSQTKKLYTYNPYYGEGSIIRNKELSTLDPRDGVALSNTKNLYTLKLHNEAASSVSHNDESNTLKPPGKWNVLSYHKILYSSKSRGEGGAVSQNKKLSSMVRGKVGPISQKQELYLPKSIDKGVAASQNKELFQIKNPGKGDMVSPNLWDPVFPEYLYTPKLQSKISPVSPEKELHKSKSLDKWGPLAQNKESYTSKSRGKTGPAFRGKELYKFKYLGKEGPLSQNKELYTSKSRGKGDPVSPKELYTSKSRGKAGPVSQNKELYTSKSRGKGAQVFKSRGKGDPVSPKELYTSKSRGKAGPVSQNKELHTSKSRGKGAQVSPNTELHASKSTGNRSVVSYYKELKTFNSLGNGSAVTPKKLHSSKSRGNGNVSFYKKLNTTKSNSKAVNKKMSGVKLQCPQNEEFRHCEHCNRTCEDPKPVCLAECSIGCFCKKTLLRDVDGSCVKLQRCSNIWKRMKRMHKDNK